LHKQLDILALEPFYGGVRRHMLETLMRCSRHRWTLLKLPPRRIERRLAVAAHWFAEQLNRHWAGNFDVLFASEALNLADLYRLMPQLARAPSVVYFHAHELPDPALGAATDAVGLANLNTATAATELWFNSRYHIRAFLAALSEMVAANRELSSRDPVPGLSGKIHYLPPPIDAGAARDQSQAASLDPADEPSLFFETRDANVQLLNEALSILAGAGKRMRLLTVGPVEGLFDGFPRTAIVETNLAAQIAALRDATAFASARFSTPFDEFAVRSLQLGKPMALPRAGVYPELLAKSLHSSTLYDADPHSLADRLADVLYLPQEAERDAVQLQRVLHQFDAIPACRAMDERLDAIVQGFGSPLSIAPAPRPQA
jgi:hypothetical protein